MDVNEIRLLVCILGICFISSMSIALIVFQIFMCTLDHINQKTYKRVKMDSFFEIFGMPVFKENYFTKHPIFGYLSPEVMRIIIWERRIFEKELLPLVFILRFIYFVLILSFLGFIIFGIIGNLMLKNSK